MSFVMNKKTVLIVEDDLVSQNLLVSISKQIGFETTVCSNGAQGVYNYIKNPDCTAVLLDLMMPGVDGYDMLKIIDSLFLNEIIIGYPKIIIETAVTDYRTLKELVNRKCVFSVRNKPISKTDIQHDMNQLAEKQLEFVNMTNKS